ncbi:MAG TPA: cysteine synthase family protein [Spirochaetota bacterium]|nr:cysteine synthase family protein [Spirochaetota bacterium]
MKTTETLLASAGVASAIGNTPVVRLRHLSPNPRVAILAKLEGANPGGSVKDRPAYYMLKKAVESGELTVDKIILEPTSGNTGIGLAMVGVSMGLRVTLCMPDCVSMERRSILMAFGAELVLTPGCQATDGAIVEARRMLEAEPGKYYMPDQFSNPANVLAHYETTAPEIIEQAGGPISAFVAGLGTTGTIMGVGRRLREHDTSTRIIAVEPPVGHTIQGLKNMTESLVPGIYNPAMIDEIVTVGDEEAFATCRDLAVREGLFCGMSSGAAVAGAIRAARVMDEGTIVTILPDRGDRYLSTALFKSVCAKCPP